jgi:hypothetical protein
MAEFERVQYSTLVGRVPIVEGATRAVYEDDDSLPAVGYDGERGYGVWLPAGG